MSSLRQSVTTLLGVVSVTAILVVFVQDEAWFFASPLEDLSRYNSAPEAPQTAVSFTVDHGRFIFFEDSVLTNKVKAVRIAAIVAFSSFLLIISGLVHFVSSDGA